MRSGRAILQAPKPCAAPREETSTVAAACRGVHASAEHAFAGLLHDSVIEGFREKAVAARSHTEDRSWKQSLPLGIYLISLEGKILKMLAGKTA